MFIYIMLIYVLVLLKLGVVASFGKDGYANFKHKDSGRYISRKYDAGDVVFACKLIWWFSTDVFPHQYPSDKVTLEQIYNRSTKSS